MQQVESDVEKLTNKINTLCFLVEQLKTGENNLKDIIDRSYKSIPDIRELLQKLDRDCS